MNIPHIFKNNTIIYINLVVKSILHYKKTVLFKPTYAKIKIIT